MSGAAQCVNVLSGAEGWDVTLQSGADPVEARHSVSASVPEASPVSDSASQERLRSRASPALPRRLSLRLRIMLFFALLAVGTIAAMIVGAWTAITQSDYVYVWEVPGLFESKVQGWLFAGFLILILVGGIWHVFDTQVVRAIDRLAAAIRTRAHVEMHGDFTEAQLDARFLGDLGPAAAELSRSLTASRTALADKVAHETSRLSSEKALLETLIADVREAVLLCTADFEMVFYNGPAVTILGAAGTPGLGRSLLDYLRAGPVRHAYARLSQLEDPDATSDLLCTTTTSGRLLAARMRVLAPSPANPRPGFVLTLRDMTAELATHSAREALLADVFERIRRPAAALQTVAGLVREDPDMARAPEMTEAILSEIGILGTAISDLGERYDKGRLDWRPLSQVRARDLMDGISAQFAALGLEFRTEAPDLMLSCDGFELALFYRWLGQRLSAAGHAHSFTLRLAEEDGPGAVLDLFWHGPPLSVGLFEQWLGESIDAELPELTAQAVLNAHGTEAWTERLVEGVSAVRLPIPRARRATRRPAAIAPRVVYDFDLLSKERNASVLDARLDDLTYVVFDTETTGLDPATDEVVQLAAVRIVNGRRLRDEVFDTLVDPQRPIPQISTDVHGITDDMVKGAPTIVQAGRRFHDFARGAVLIAHNAPFDMEFLRRHEAGMQLRFDQPILDTMLLSAAVYGPSELHSLDALSARLGVTISEEDRHTALGDTLATAEVFLRLVPILRARGYQTFGDVLGEMRRHGDLLPDPNEARP
ncbi:MAG: exonuclease domain-containing protein [Roseinatronobacter sp.]